MKNFKQLRERDEVWDRPNPKAERGESEKLSPAQKARARARARAAGRAYPNMVDNIWAARNEAAVMESGGDKIFKNANGHVEKYSDDSYAVYRNGQKQTFYTTLDAAKAALTEAKDPREYDYEGDMARSQLRSIIANAQQVHDMLSPDTNMAEWVQSKITLAADYISTAADYMQSEHGEMAEATYQGKKVPLNKPMAGDVKKSKVFVDPDGDGKATKVNFGDKNMTIKKHIPARRASFRARHNCDDPGPKDKARYWSCKAW